MNETPSDALETGVSLPLVSRPAGRKRVFDWLGGAGLVVLLAWIPLITRLRSPANGDELNFHIPSVLRFRDHFPTLEEMRRTNLSMPPLWHGLMGWIASWSGDSLPALRIWMILTGVTALTLFLLCSRRLGQADWPRGGIWMAAFPYFGACYFIVMTDIPSLLAVLVAVFAQIDYLQTGRERSVWTAGIVGLAAILIRQNAIYVTAVFGAALVLTRFRGNFFLTPRRPLRIWRELLPLGLPLLGLLWEVRLWDGLVPPDYSTESGTYLDASLRTYLLGLSSTAGNVGYYFMPATLILLATHRPRPHVRAWILLGLLATLGTCWCYHERGTDLVNTYGTFRHSLNFIRDRFGFAPSAAILFLSILSFGVILRLGMDELKSRERRLLLLLPVLLSLGSWMIISFGLFRIYERHVVPIYTFAVLLLWPSVDWAKNRWWQAGWLMSVLFGAGHSVLYAVRAYEMRR